MPGPTDMPQAFQTILTYICNQPVTRWIMKSWQDDAGMTSYANPDAGLVMWTDTKQAWQELQYLISFI